LKRDYFNFRINHQIKAKEVRVIDSDGKQIGILKLDEAIKKAQDKDLELIEIAPKANPPVCKIIELGKFKYEEEKKKKKGKKGKKGGEIKEIRFSPFIGNADYQTRLDKIKQFLQEGNKIRGVVKFKGRQMGSKTFGYNVLNKLFDDLGRENINIDMPPKFIGRHLTCVVSPMSKAKSASKKNEKQTKDKKNNN
jgi:translation initiation factor IF-3